MEPEILLYKFGQKWWFSNNSHAVNRKISNPSATGVGLILPDRLPNDPGRATKADRLRRCGGVAHRNEFQEDA